MATYTCPNGHQIEADAQTAPECRKCHLVAVAYNAGAGKVYEWRTRADVDETNERLGDMTDSAIDHRYFGEW